jgi:hypothetical protein
VLNALVVEGPAGFLVEVREVVLPQDGRSHGDAILLIEVTDARDLYGLPLERFVAERSALAKSLRADGQRSEADRVAKLRKPSVAAWAVNQLVRTQRDAVEELFEAGEELRRAHDDLLAGRGDTDALRQAAERERTAVQLLTSTARGLLSSEGHELSPAMLERVGETLHAAALDQDARGKVAAGCLERELRHVGLGPGQPQPTRMATRSEPRKKRADRERSERLKVARRAAGDARRAAERSARELRAAEQRRERAAVSLAEAETDLADARRRAEEAGLAQREAEAALADAGER